MYDNMLGADKTKTASDPVTTGKTGRKTKFGDFLDTSWKTLKDTAKTSDYSINTKYGSYTTAKNQPVSTQSTGTTGIMDTVKNNLPIVIGIAVLGGILLLRK